MSEEKLGVIEVIVGPMYAGKSEELVRRARRSLYSRQGVLICSKDTRWGRGNLVTHGGQKAESTYMESADELLAADISKYSVICVDEGQFFGPNLKDVCISLASQGKKVIVAGLDMDYLEAPFENMSFLMGVAEHVTKLTAVCECGRDATRTHRKIKDDRRVLEGADAEYEPLCRRCYIRKTL